ncbi:MAG: SDR family NAD(P)-dependent oxidoreductase, partial [Gammaproteobacteria bacterium]
AYQGAHRVFNVGDGNHASMGEYFRRVAAIAGLPAPEELEMETLLARSSPMMRSFLQESRRLDSGLMRSELGYRPLFQDLDQGIEASLREDAAGG